MNTDTKSTRNIHFERQAGNNCVRYGLESRKRCWNYTVDASAE